MTLQAEITKWVNYPASIVLRARQAMAPGKIIKVKIAGKKARKNALKVGMSCDFRYFGVADLAKNITCK